MKVSFVFILFLMLPCLIFAKGVKDVQSFQTSIFTLDYKGDANKNIGKFTVAIALNPNDSHAYVARGFAYFGIGRFGEAIFDFSSAISVNPKDSRAYLARGLTFAIMGES
jgi:tetratricopeptide (TPR) repeat protein